MTRDTRRKLTAVAAAVALVGACGGEKFTSDPSGGGEAGTSKSGSGGGSSSGGAPVKGGSKNSGGLSGGGKGDAGELGSGGSPRGGRDGEGDGGSLGGEDAGGIDGGEAGAGAGGAHAGGTVGSSGGKSNATGGASGGFANSGSSGGKTGGSGGIIGGSGGKTGGTGGTLGGSGGTLGSGGSIIVGGGGGAAECQLPVGATVIVDEPFDSDLFNGSGWMRTDTSVTVSGGAFKIASDGQYDDYGDIGLSAVAPIVVEVRMRNVSGGTEELTPVVEVHFGTDSPGVVSISYNAHAGYGWIFGPPGVNTGSTIGAPASEGVWVTIRAFLRVNGGTLCVKRDDDATFALAGSSSWQLPKAITRLRLRQNYDDVSEVDRATVRQLP